MKKARLDRVEPSVITFQVVVVLSNLAVIAQHLDRAHQRRVIAGYGSAFATSSEIFPRIEAEGGRAPH